MILSVGEILADMLGGGSCGRLDFEAHVGGAPFNLAYNAKAAGAKVGFIGRVGDDVVGRFLTENTKDVLDYISLQTDPERNTTLAFVTVTDGERDFSFYRRGTADYFIDAGAIDLGAFADLTTVHIGSLMLSEPEGRACAAELSDRVKKAGAKISFDVNFRSDIFRSADEAKSAYNAMIGLADIVKFSEDEVSLFAGEGKEEEYLRSLAAAGKLVAVTYGKRGSAYFFGDKSGSAPTEAVKPVDTTGCGDAFFGTFLACVDGGKYDETNLLEALVRGNAAGAKTALFKGAIPPLKRA